MDYNFSFDIVKSGVPIITLSSYGIGFNQVSRSLLGNPEKINIGFDKDKMTLGVKPHVNNTNTTSFEFESKVRNEWVRIGCKDFTKYLSVLSGIDFISSAKQFIANYDEENNFLIINIDEEHLKSKKK